jgi:hypothetical protein
VHTKTYNHASIPYDDQEEKKEEEETEEREPVAQW